MRACVHEKMREKMRRCVRAKTSACCVVETQKPDVLAADSDSGPPRPLLALTRYVHSTHEEGTGDGS